MRFLHSADWQIGMKAVNLLHASEAVRAARLEAAEQVIDIASEHQVDFLLLAGDTFEHNSVAASLVKQVAEILGRAHCPVFVLPGNHDPLVAGSVWEHPIWAEKVNITILRERRAYSVAGGELLACPLFRKSSPDNPTAWIDPMGRDNEGIRIVAAHGSLPLGSIEAPEYPIPFETPERTNADYVALGHWHSTFKCPRMAYSGTHETTKFKEPDSGNILLIEIAERGSEPNLQSVRSGTLRWQTLGDGKRITLPGQLKELLEIAEAVPVPQKTLLKVTLEGLDLPENQQDLSRLRNALARCLFGSLDDERLLLAPQADDAWMDDLPAGAIRQTALRLRTLAEAPQTAAIARQALVQLFQFAQEGLAKC